MPTTLRSKDSLVQLQAAFLPMLPKIQTHARFAFRYIRCYHSREDAIAETVALCWFWFLRLVKQGKDPTRFPSILASYATRHVKAGRRLCGQEKAREVLSPVTQQRHNFCVSKLPECSTLSNNPLAEALIDNTVSPVPDQVAFRIDWPRWHRQHSPQKRQIVTVLALGHGTLELARQFHISPARVSQLRRELHRSWRRFQGELPRQTKKTVGDAA